MAATIAKWTANSDNAMKTNEDDASLVRANVQGKEVFITVLMLSQPSPFDHMSFGLSLTNWRIAA